MKKTTYLIGILFASLAFCTSTKVETFATDNTNIIAEIPAPSKAELEQSLETVKSLPGYSTYAPMTNSEREQATPLFREYRYLAEVVKTGEAMIDNYDNQTFDDLNSMLKAANDAVIACRLIFKNIAENSQTTTDLADSKASQSTPSAETTSSNSNANIKKTETLVVATSMETSLATTETETQSEDLSATNDESKSDTPNNFVTNLLAHTTTAFIATGTLITNRKKLPFPHRH